VIPFFALIIIGCSNAVNLTDGLDGLATGCTISVALSYSMLAYLAGHFFMATEYLVIPHNRYLAELAVFMMALAGAAFGFLWFNCHPAKVFMGDTGSLAIGGALGAAAICTKQELLLIIIGGVFVMEAASVILQVGFFKATKGKRLFRMAPLQHHFELMGWAEVTIVIRFWIIAGLCVAAGLGVFYAEWVAGV
jgi:phospho-N-acetylmuramoyl-pentapeptide-transferase